MIVRPMGEQIRLITQHDHARAAGTIARHWRRAEVCPPPSPPVREAFFYAVDNHDVGWCGPDARPRLDPETKQPLSFFGTTAEEATEVWTEGIAFCERYRPFSGYLVSLHFCGLAEAARQGAPPEEMNHLQRFVAAERERQERLAGGFTEPEGASKEALAMLLRICDTLSLLACRAPEISPPEGRVLPLAKGGLRVRLIAGDGIELAPWPFEEESRELRFPGFTIPGVRFETAEDLDEAWPKGEPGMFVVRLTALCGTNA